MQITLKTFDLKKRFSMKLKRKDREKTNLMVLVKLADTPLEATRDT